jgi:hypothetical protein
VTQILLGLGLERSVVLGLLILLGLECRILLKIGLLYKQGWRPYASIKPKQGSHPKLIRSN